ncbi:thiosulfate oxidation carrier complex protein SoxZ [[Pseudomonas] carboxydohydrogena]|uniref:Thiosulfate oxidation carrier complex protein SoxZ n=1 Tax=Afipia carboxydohydrogena TaxID=290 RepID=A0ABY8BP59_AFICR|nr:thiosulfate oxidation carrier complex protein SoxZ [[Pseudomonas] carboxydohydrogena]WEF50714.1 thiosulfate oxidation carrier complex protein SoxZ [[Pseudomonas] carboxydohydrogena]
MSSTIRIQARLIGDLTEVQTLIKHPMDSGFGKDPDGKLIPAHYIETLSFEHNGKPVFSADWGPTVARQPYVKFSFKGGKVGDTITAKWIDNKRAADSAKTQIKTD